MVRSLADRTFQLRFFGELRNELNQKPSFSEASGHLIWKHFPDDHLAIAQVNPDRSFTALCILNVVFMIPFIFIFKGCQE